MTTKERNYGLKKKCEKLQHENKVLKRALELACNLSNFEDTCDYCAYQSELEITRDCPCFCETQDNFHRDQAIGYFIQQAEEEVTEDDKL